MDQGTLLKRVVFASLIGATVEWYDFFLYGVVAGIVLNRLYFPAGDPIIATLLALTRRSPLASSRAPWTASSSVISATGSAARAC